MNPELTVIVPFKNEKRTIPELVNRLVDLNASVDFSCVFVNDGSTDDSQNILNDCLSNSSLKYRLVSKSNGGKSSAIREGIKEVQTSHVVILDADLELDPRDIGDLWKVVKDGRSGFVFGYREFRAHSAFTYRYTLGNRFISNVYGMFFNQVISDIMCGLKLVPTDFLRKLDFRYKRFGLEVEIPIRMWGQNIRPYEVPVSYSPRGWADGKTIGIRDAFQIILSIVTSRLKLAVQRARRD